MTRVWPALCPPWNRTTTSACSESQSTILPLPSSPHWAPTTTTFAISRSSPSAPETGEEAAARARVAALAAYQGVKAPGSWAGEHQIQEHKAVQDGGVAPVEHRKQVARRMRHPVRDRHLAREQEGDRPGEQAEQEERPAHEFEQARDPGHGCDRGRVGMGREAEQLLGSVQEKDQGRDDAQDAEHARRPQRKSVGVHAALLGSVVTPPTIRRRSRLVPARDNRPVRSNPKRTTRTLPLPCR